MNLEIPIKTLTTVSASAKAEKHAAKRTKGKIWIDLDNTPHVPFFAPIIEELQKCNYSVMVTARDCFQVRELADLLHLNYKLIGHHSGKSRIRKVAGLCFRALQLIPTILRERPDLAISHCSRSQLIASILCRVSSFFLGDYEFATAWILIYPTWHMRPEVIPDETLPWYPSRNLKYPGIKEDVYVPRFVPNPGIRSQLGLREDDLVVTVRPAASEAHYHCQQSDELFDAAVEYLSNEPDLFSSGKMRIPEKVVDGLNLIWNSDFVISGGGTMNREAAALRVPVYSVFRGKIGAVDRYLAERGRLVLLETVQDVRARIRVVRRDRPAKPQNSSEVTLNSIVKQIVAVMEGKRPDLSTYEAAGLDQLAPLDTKRISGMSSPHATK